MRVIKLQFIKRRFTSQCQIVSAHNKLQTELCNLSFLRNKAKLKSCEKTKGAQCYRPLNNCLESTQRVGVQTSAKLIVSCTYLLTFTLTEKLLLKASTHGPSGRPVWTARVSLQPSRRPSDGRQVWCWKTSLVLTAVWTARVSRPLVGYR